MCIATKQREKPDKATTLFIVMSVGTTDLLKRVHFVMPVVTLMADCGIETFGGEMNQQQFDSAAFMLWIALIGLICAIVERWIA